MNKSRKLVPALAAIGFALVGTMAQAATVNFSITGATIGRGDGYGVDTSNGNGQGQGQDPENAGKLLDVLFGTTNFLAQGFELEAGGAGHTFDFGTVHFRELNTGNGNGNVGIRTDETDFLDVVVSLTLNLPTPMALTLAAIVTTATGPIDDAAVDFALAWTPLEVTYGNGGKFNIALNTLSFSQSNTSRPLTATVTLRTAASDDPPPATPVPEPATLALAAIALAGIGASRRRRTA